MSPIVCLLFVTKFRKGSCSHRQGCFSINRGVTTSMFSLLTKLITPANSGANCRSTHSYHCYKMEQIHAWLVGFGVSQFEQGWNPKSSGVPGIPPLRSHIRGQNNTHGQTHTHIHHTTTLNKQWYDKPHTDSVTSLITHTQTPLVPSVLCTDKKMVAALSAEEKRGKQIK